MSLQIQTRILDSAEATAHCASALGKCLRTGDVVLLTGDVGAGKSHFARSLILSLLDVPEDVPSPTFTLVQTYETKAGAIWHADLYRLTDIQEIEELGLIEAFEDAICLIEWPDRLGPLAPANALSLELTPGPHDDARMLSVTYQESDWKSRLKGWPL